MGGSRSDASTVLCLEEIGTSARTSVLVFVGVLCDRLFPCCFIVKQVFVFGVECTVFMECEGGEVCDESDHWCPPFVDDLGMLNDVACVLEAGGMFMQ